MLRLKRDRLIREIMEGHQGKNDAESQSVCYYLLQTGMPSCYQRDGSA